MGQLHKYGTDIRNAHNQLAKAKTRGGRARALSDMAKSFEYLIPEYFDETKWDAKDRKMAADIDSGNFP